MYQGPPLDHTRAGESGLSVYKIDPGARIFDTARIVKASHRIVIEDKCLVCDFAFIGARDFMMEYGSQIGIGAIIGGGGRVYIGKYCTIGSNAMLLPATESPDAKLMCEAAPEDQRKIIRGSITLREGAYIGVGATVCVTEDHPDILIGPYSIVGAGVYLDKDVPAYTTVIPKQELIFKERNLK